MRVKRVVGSVLVLALAACGGKDKAGHAEPAHGGEAHASAEVSLTGAPTVAEIAALFDLWNHTLQSGSAHDMAALYAEDGVLLPTVSNQARNNRPEITDYFEHFLQLSPKGVINEQYIDILDEDTAVNSGVYTFDVVRNGQPGHVVARYSYVYQKIAGKWLIKSHHSSAMPEEMEERPAPLPERARAQRVAHATVVSHAASVRRAQAARASAAPAEAGHGGGHAAPAAAAGHGGGH